MKLDRYLEQGRLAPEETLADAIEAMLESLHERLAKFERMIGVDEAEFDGESKRLAAQKVSVG